MKRVRFSSISAMLVWFAVMSFVFQGCGGGGSTGSGITPAKKSSFDEVTAKLDKGGTFYMYASTEKIMKTLDEVAVSLRKIMEMQAGKEPEKMKWALSIFDFVYGLVKKVGVMEISGIGISSVPIEGELNHTRVAVHHYKDKSSGLMWQLMKDGPHELGALKLLPANTVLAGFGDAKFKHLWEWIKKEAENSSMPKFKEGLAQLEPMMQKQGLDLLKLLDGLTGEIGYVITFDETNMKKMPMGNVAMEIPDPALAIVLPLKDGYLFDLLESKMKFAKKAEKEGITMLQIPMRPMPITVKPVIAKTGSHIVIASNTAILDAMLAAEKDGNGLTGTDEFKRLSAHIPTKGNSFRYTSPRFTKAITGLWEKMVQQSRPMDSEAKAAAKMFMKLFSGEIGVFAVTQHLEDGGLTVMNHTMGMEYALLMPAVFVTGIVAAIAIPNMLTALSKGKQKATMGDMKTMGMAIESYITDLYFAPKVQSVEELAKILEPFYIKRLPRKDGWGFDFHYVYGMEGQQDAYAIGSGGKDGSFDSWEQTGFYRIRDIKQFAGDIIFKNGQFVLGPKIK